MSSNGHDGQRYNGDGVELNSSGATVTGNHITRNGDGVGFEHGIYAGSTARRYTITGNTIGGNAGADVKAAGGPGLVANNRLMSGLFGVVLSDNPAPVTVQYNLIQGRFQHGILLTTGHTAARARLWNNTVQQTGRSTRSGNASAVFVASATLLELRNNLFAYTNSDALGTALMINDRARLRELPVEHELVLEHRQGAPPAGLERLARDVRPVAHASRVRTRPASTRRRRASPPAGASPRATWAPPAARAWASPATTPGRLSIPRSSPTSGRSSTPEPAFVPARSGFPRA